MKRLLCLVALAVALLLPSRAFAAAKTYQVTGKVLEVTDKMIAVEKGKDRWEIDRDADTKVDGDLKVGEKVTITYHMTANKVEAKEGSSSSDKKSDDSKK